MIQGYLVIPIGRNSLLIRVSSGIDKIEICVSGQWVLWDAGSAAKTGDVEGAIAVLRAPPTWTSANPDATCAKTPQEGIVGTAARAAIRSLLGRSSQSKEGLLSEAHRFLVGGASSFSTQLHEILE